MTFPFASELFCLFFDRLPEIGHNFVRHPRRLLIQVQMHMSGEMMPKRGLSEYPARISSDALELLASEDDNMFVMVLCP